jgi:hypothetical protein
VVICCFHYSSLSFLGLTIVARTLCGGLDKHYGLLTKSGLITSAVYGIIPTRSQLIFQLCSSSTQNPVVQIFKIAWVCFIETTAQTCGRNSILRNQIKVRHETTLYATKPYFVYIKIESFQV